MGSRFASGAANTWLKRLLLSAAVAWLVLAGVVLGRYADEAVPTSYVLRPLVVVTFLALVIGLLCSIAGRWAVGVAAALVAAIGLFPLGFFVGVALLVSLVVASLAERSGRRWPIALQWQRVALTLSTVFFLLSTVRAISYIDPSQEAASTSTADGRGLYLVLLDGYPRADTLSHEFGIDNGPFLSLLEERGFEVYEDAQSPRGYTELTLASMLNASDTGVPVESGSVEDQRASRRRLDEARLPRIAMDAGYEYVVIDSPIGHVTFNTGTHIRHSGVNNFEERLVAETLLAHVVLGNAPDLLTSSLRTHLDDSLASLVELSSPGPRKIVLAHLLAPHLPALYAADGSGLPLPSYWPKHQLFGSVAQDIDISVADYRDMYSGHLAAVNQRLVATIDAMLARDPDAVIVLFSDHGSRYSFDTPDEWTRSFLAARTPGRAHLFGESPMTTNLLCDLFTAYLDLPCQ